MCMLKTFFKKTTHISNTYKFNHIYFCRSTFPLSTEATLRAANAPQTYQLWASVSSALCGCVNNPQNGNVICVFVPCTKCLICKTLVLFPSRQLLYSQTMGYCIKFISGVKAEIIFAQLCLSFVFQRRVSVFVWQPFP